MIGESKRLLQTLRTVLANLYEAIGQTGALLATDAIEALADGRGHRCGHGFPRPLRKLFGQAVRFRVFDIQSHRGTILPQTLYLSTTIGPTLPEGV
jgi:hypothetical protein